MLHPGCKGLLVEPNPLLKRDLQKKFQDCSGITFLPYAVSNKSGSCPFYYFDDISGMPKWADQIGSLSRKHLLNVSEANGFSELAISRIQKKDVRVVRFNELVEEYSVSSIGLLHMDAEGEDANILLDINFLDVEIQDVVFEHKHSDGFKQHGFKYEQIFKHLLKNGYECSILDEENARARRVKS